jgi:transposase
LVPKQHGTGGRLTLLGISKNGDRYLRSLLIHGARGVALGVIQARPHAAGALGEAIDQRRGRTRATVA